MLLSCCIGNSSGILCNKKCTTVQVAHAAPMGIWLQCSRAAAQGLASETLSCIKHGRFIEGWHIVERRQCNKNATQGLHCGGKERCR